MSSSPLRIAIIGGGPAGLTLGVLLHKRGIPFTIFELRQKPTEEEFTQPAGSLDLHDESGLAALRECGLFNEFASLTGDCSEMQRIADKNGNIMYANEGSLGNRPEISRNKLSQLLLSNIPASSIKWDHKLVSTKSITKYDNTEIELDFGRNSRWTFDFAIGADGAWSKTRALLTDVKPHYIGLQVITINIRQITTRFPHLAELIGHGTFTSLGNRHGVFSQRSVRDSARIYIFISTENEHFAVSTGIRNQTAAQAKDYLLLSDSSPISKWNTSIKELVAVGCDDESANSPDANIDIKPLYTLPVGHRWEHQPGMTVIGDAAHLINPPAGEGVNIAMRDSLLLSQTISKAHDMAGQDAASLRNALDQLIRGFEIEMMARAKRTAEWSQRIGEIMFGGEEGATALADKFTSFQPCPD